LIFPTLLATPQITDVRGNKYSEISE